MFKRCCLWTSCYKNEDTLIDNDYHKFAVKHSNNQFIHEKCEKERKDLDNLLDQARQIIDIQKNKIASLTYEINHIAPVIKIEEIKTCKRVANCKHDKCDFNPLLSTIEHIRQTNSSLKTEYDLLLTTYNKNKSLKDKIKHLEQYISGMKRNMEDKNNTITDLENRIQYFQSQISNLTNNLTWFHERTAHLEKELEHANNDNRYLEHSQRFFKKEAQKSKKLIILPPISEEKCDNTLSFSANLNLEKCNDL